MACVNTKGKVDNNIKEDGNAYWFELNADQVDRLSKGLIPLNGHFGTFQDLLQFL